MRASGLDRAWMYYHGLGAMGAGGRNLPGLLHFLLLRSQRLVPFAPSLTVPKHTSSSVLPPVEGRET